MAFKNLTSVSIFIILITISCLLVTMEAKSKKHKERTKLAGYVVFRKQPTGIEFLLLEQTKEPHRWTPPKGRVDHNETDLAAATRELKEETGLTEDDINVIINFKKVFTYGKTKNPKEIVYRLALLHEPDKAITLSSEHTQYKWLPIKDALEIADEISQQVVEEADKYLTAYKY